MEKNNKTNKRSNENLKTTIGDLLRSQGNNILNTPKPKYNKNNKKKNYPKKKDNNYKPDVKPEITDAPVDNVTENVDHEAANKSLKEAIDRAIEKGILKDDIIKIEDPKPITNDDLEYHDGTWAEFSGSFLAPKEEPKKNEPINKIKINSEYITFSNTDARIRTDSYKR